MKRNANEVSYNTVMRNVKMVGNKKYAEIPVDLIFADPKFQRTDCYSKAKVKAIAEHWDETKLDTLRVSAHAEAFKFSAIDGFHRLSAAKEVGIDYLPCEILEFSSDNRLVCEANVFVGQDDLKEPLTPQQKHRAYMISGVKANLTLQKLVDAYNIALKPDLAHFDNKVGVLNGFTAALALAKTGEEYLDHTFSIIEKAKWNLNSKGYTKDVIQSIGSMLKLHGCNKEIAEALVAYMKPIDPDKFFAEARVTYPERRKAESMVLVLEDFVVKNFNISRVYYGGIVKKVA